MNVTMSDCTYVAPSHREQRRFFSDFCVQGRLIRYVQIPPEIDMEQGRKEETGINNTSNFSWKILMASLRSRL